MNSKGSLVASVNEAINSIHDEDSTMVIAGGVGVVALLAVVVIGMYFLRKKQEEATTPDNAAADVAEVLELDNQAQKLEEQAAHDAAAVAAAADAVAVNATPENQEALAAEQAQQAQTQQKLEAIEKQRLAKLEVMKKDQLLSGTSIELNKILASVEEYTKPDGYVGWNINTVFSKKRDNIVSTVHSQVQEDQAVQDTATLIKELKPLIKFSALPTKVTKQLEVKDIEAEFGDLVDKSLAASITTRVLGRVEAQYSRLPALRAIPYAPTAAQTKQFKDLVKTRDNMAAVRAYMGRGYLFSNKSYTNNVDANAIIEKIEEEINQSKSPVFEDLQKNLTKIKKITDPLKRNGNLIEAMMQHVDQMATIMAINVKESVRTTYNAAQAEAKKAAKEAKKAPKK